MNTQNEILYFMKSVTGYMKALDDMTSFLNSPNLKTNGSVTELTAINKMCDYIKKLSAESEIKVKEYISSKNYNIKEEVNNNGK